MAFYTAVTGGLGDGKGLCTMAMIVDYLKRGKPVVTNMDIFPENFRNPYNKNVRIYRIPDYPCEADFEMCGTGNPTKDPLENGLAALDEMATWFNSHDWNSKEAKALNKMFVHLRKMGWDGAFQIQSIDSLNSQLRKAIIKSVAECQAVKEVYIPILSPIIRTIIGKQWRLPKSAHYHKVVKYQVNRNGTLGVLQDKFRYKGKDYWDLYDTSQIFVEDYPHGTFCYLTPWHLVGRYLPPEPSFLYLLSRGLKLPLILLFLLIDKIFHTDSFTRGPLKKIKINI